MFAFIGMMAGFLLLLFAELYTGNKNIEITLKEISEVKTDHRLITAISIVIFMYNMQFLVFPAY